MYSPDHHHTHSSGFRKTASISASRDPLAGSCMYSHLRTEHQSYRATQVAHYWDKSAVDLCCVYLAVRGRDIRMLSILEPGVARPNFTPRSYTRLNSTYLKHKHTQSDWFISGVFNSLTGTDKGVKGRPGSHADPMMLTFLVWPAASLSPPRWRDRWGACIRWEGNKAPQCGRSSSRSWTPPPGSVSPGRQRRSPRCPGSLLCGEYRSICHTWPKKSWNTESK